MYSTQNGARLAREILGFENEGLGSGNEGVRGGLVFKAHRLVYHSTLGWRVIKRREYLHAVGSASPRGESRRRRIYTYIYICIYIYIYIYEVWVYLHAVGSASPRGESRRRRVRYIGHAKSVRSPAEPPPEPSTEPPARSGGSMLRRKASPSCEHDCLHFRVQGAGFRVQSSGFRVQGSGFMLQGLGCGV